MISKILSSKFHNSCPFFDQFTPLTDQDLANLRVLGHFLKLTYDLAMPPIKSPSIKIYHPKSENFNSSSYAIFTQIFVNQTKKLRDTLNFKNLDVLLRE